MVSIKHLLCAAVGAGVLVGASSAAAPAAPAQEAAAPLGSGIDLQYIDTSVRPQDNLFLYANGKWLAATEIPPDKGRYGVFDILADEAREQLHAIVGKLQVAADPADPDQRKIADLYTSFVDEAEVEKAGLAPLKAEFARIDALSGKDQIPALIAHFNRIGVVAPYAAQVHQDARDSSKYIFDISQDGLGMPDRDYYLKQDDALAKIRAQYLQHVERMLALAGDGAAARNAEDIVSLETALAKVQWTKVENRDPQKTYNKVAFAGLPKLAPGFDWNSYLAGAGVEGKADYLVVSQPSYFTELARLVADTPLPTWKAYFRWHLLSDSAPYLDKALVDEHFAFYGTALRGVQQNELRWKRGIRLVNASIGEGLGRLYVAQYFPPESKARMEQLVKNLLAAYKADIDTLEWMGPETRAKAQVKLAKFTVKIGYPVKWRDYSALKVSRDDLVGNVMRAASFDYDRNLAKLGQPVDRTEWGMSPQTVNAYYNPEMNEIVFPAAILQPPFFNPTADDAVNYGGIVAVIGHEVSHGFDDQGSQFDADGNLHDWFTKEDHERFAAKTKALVAQYDAYEPVPGYHVNGQLTLGENIADNSGLTLAYQAYRQSLGGKPAPVIAGYTGEQRFFLGWVQVWRGKVREAEQIRRIKTDPHSPSAVRGTAPLKNQPALYGTFELKPGDGMYLSPDQRVIIW